MKDRWLFKAKSFNFKNFGWQTGLLEKRHENEFLINYIKIDEATICQCTGLTDCEGNLIFENDIVFDYQLDESYEVTWNDGAWWLNDRLEYSSNDYRIIGNIHDKEA